MQHPALADAALEPFRAVLGRTPDLREPALASWNDATMTGEQVSRLAEQCAVDAEIVPMGARLTDYRLIAFDMDSTLITIECVDEIADYAGRRAEVAAITEAAMRGEIADYDESLRRRVALLAGLPVSALQEVYDQRVRPSPGAERLIGECRRAGLKVMVVSGGFTFFTDRLRERFGLDYTHASSLEVANGRLTGGLVGEIVNANVKKRVVEQVCAEAGCTPAQTIVVGDGANDLKMMSIAGLSVAYRAKPIVRSETTHAINHCGLDAILGFFAPTR